MLSQSCTQPKSCTPANPFTNGSRIFYLLNCSAKSHVKPAAGFHLRISSNHALFANQIVAHLTPRKPVQLKKGQICESPVGIRGSSANLNDWTILAVTRIDRVTWRGQCPPSGTNQATSPRITLGGK
jgi:hypothetical protein